MGVRFGATRLRYDGGALLQARAGDGVPPPYRGRGENGVGLLGALRSRQQLRGGRGLERDAAWFEVSVEGKGGEKSGGWGRRASLGAGRGECGRLWRRGARGGGRGGALGEGSVEAAGGGGAGAVGRVIAAPRNVRVAAHQRHLLRPLLRVFVIVFCL